VLANQVGNGLRLWCEPRERVQLREVETLVSSLLAATALLPVIPVVDCTIADSWKFGRARTLVPSDCRILVACAISLPQAHDPYA
jgi:hypothetical protein